MNFRFVFKQTKLIYFVVSLSDLSQTRAIEDIRADHNMSLHPYFDYDVARNVTARLGQSAFLHCRVEQLGDKSVSQIYTFEIKKKTTTKII